jgi:hypothetical protein
MDGWWTSAPPEPLRLEGLSRMKGNLHVRFLGGWRVVTSSGYPVDVRLSPHPAQHLWSFSIIMQRLCPLRWHAPKFIRVSSHCASMHEKRSCTASAFAGSLVRHLPLSAVLPKARGLRRGDTPRGDGVTVLRLLCPLRLSVRALACRWGLPSLLPTRLDIPHEVSRVQHGGRQRHDAGGVLLAAPSVLSGSPVTIPGRAG